MGQGSTGGGDARPGKMGGSRADPARRIRPQQRRAGPRPTRGSATTQAAGGNQEVISLGRRKQSPADSGTGRRGHYVDREDPPLPCWQSLPSSHTGSIFAEVEPRPQTRPEDPDPWGPQTQGNQLNTSLYHREAQSPHSMQESPPGFHKSR